jgi:cytochrome c biogenesis protein CcmG, thiol:disulfide interchange protein DsbE
VKGLVFHTRSALGLLASMLVLTCCSSPSRAPQTLPDVTLAALDGSTLPLRQYAGHPLWINFFATWCPPCVAEIPDIERLYRTDKSKGLIVLGIDRQENAAVVRHFAAQHGLSYSLAIDNGAVAQALDLGALPVSVFVSRDGTVRAIRSGQLSAADMQTDVGSVLAQSKVDPSHP